MAVGGDAHGPLAQLTLEHREVATFGLAFGGDLLVGKHSTQTRAPVHRRLGDVGQTEIIEHIGLLGLAQVGPCDALMAGDGLLARFELGDQFADRSSGTLGTTRIGGVLVIPRVVDTRKNPLGPAHIARIDGRETAAIVEAQAHAMQLTGHVGDIRLGGHTRMLTGLDRILFRRQAEGVIAHRMQHVLALHTMVTAHHIGCEITQRMADVQTLAGRVREHVHREIRRTPLGITPLAVLQVAGDIRRPERTLVIPLLLPFGFDILRHCGVVTELRFSLTHKARN